MNFIMFHSGYRRFQRSNIMKSNPYLITLYHKHIQQLSLHFQGMLLKTQPYICFFFPGYSFRIPIISKCPLRNTESFLQNIGVSPMLTISSHWFCLCKATTINYPYSNHAYFSWSISSPFKRAKLLFLGNRQTYVQVSCCNVVNCYLKVFCERAPSFQTY